LSSSSFVQPLRSCVNSWSAVVQCWTRCVNELLVRGKRPDALGLVKKVCQTSTALWRSTARDRELGSAKSTRANTFDVGFGRATRSPFPASRP